MSGAAQCIAGKFNGFCYLYKWGVNIGSVLGICFILGTMLHPMAWGIDRVHTLCGRDSSPFYLGSPNFDNNYLNLIMVR